MTINSGLLQLRYSLPLLSVAQIANCAVAGGRTASEPSGAALTVRTGAQDDVINVGSDTTAFGDNARGIAMRLPLRIVRHVSLGLERAQHGEDGGVREVIVEAVPHLGDGAGASGPQHSHHVQLASRKHDLVHVRLLLKFS